MNFSILLLAGAIFAAQVPQVAQAQAAPAHFEILRGSVAVEACTERQCHPTGFLNQGDRGKMTLAAQVDGEWYAYLEGEGVRGWAACHIPDGPAHYVIISDITGVVVARCADYRTS